MQWDDPIVNEVREVRDQIAARHGYDIRSIGRYYQSRQAASGKTLVTLPPRKNDAPNVTGKRAGS
jgi:hypothetical protein